MTKIISFEEYKNDKSVENDNHEEIYNYLYSLIDTNIEIIIETLEKAINKSEFNEILYGFINQSIKVILVSRSKEEILGAIERGAINRLQHMAGEVLFDYPVINDIYNGLRK